jgi:hypothetical protein
MGRFLPKLNYSNVMVTGLAFIVLGGGAYAATQLPKNSVGSKQIRKGSIKPSDLSAKAKRALRGPTGPTGAQGQPAQAGPSEVFTQANALGGSIVCCSRTEVLTMDVPSGPGRYLVLFQGTLSANPEGIGYLAHVYLRHGGADIAVISPSGAAKFLASMRVVADLSPTDEISVEIEGTDTDQVISYDPGALELIVLKDPVLHENP